MRDLTPGQLTEQKRRAEERAAQRRLAAELVGSRWLNVSEGAAYGRTNACRMRQAVKAGMLRASKIGGKGQFLFKAEWIDQWIEDQATSVMVTVRRRA